MSSNHTNENGATVDQSRPRRSRWSKKRKRTSTSLLLHDSDCDDPSDSSSSHPGSPWSSELHRNFVKAVFEIGIEQSSPAVIAEQMITKNHYNTEDAVGTERNEMKHLSEVEYYKRELTGERLKSHLQKLRKQRDRETDIFMEEYNRFLHHQQILDSKEKQIQRFKEQQRRRRSDGHKEEEERLLSMYLPLQSGDCDMEVDEASFPAGGRAIGMLTWAVQQEEKTNRKKRKHSPLEAQQKQKHHHQHHHYHHHQSPPTPNGWETASVDSWTSHTAIAAGKVATALASNSHENRILDCGSSEDESEDEGDPFRASVPTLTTAEQSSPLGISLRLTWDMIRHMHGVILEARASKKQQLASNTKQQQQTNSKTMKTQHAIDEFSSEDEELSQDLQVSTSEPHKKDHFSLALFSARNESEPTPPLITTQVPNAAASALLHHQWNPLANTHLLAAMAANGMPPATLVEALGPGKLGAPSIVSPQSQSPAASTTPELREKLTGALQSNPAVSAFKGSIFPPDPQFVSLSTPTTPAEAMFASFLQHNQHSKE